MINVFTLNENGKIEMTKEELGQALNGAYWAGFYSNNCWSYINFHFPYPIQYQIVNNSSQENK